MHCQIICFISFVIAKKRGEKSIQARDIWVFFDLFFFMNSSEKKRAEHMSMSASMFFLFSFSFSFFVY